MSSTVKQPNVIKAIYKHGIFEPTDTIQGLLNDQAVQLQIWPIFYEDSPFLETTEKGDDTNDEANDEEWQSMSPWEQQGRRRPFFSLEEEVAALQRVHAQWASLSLPSEQAIEIATAEWLIEESLWL